MHVFFLRLFLYVLVMLGFLFCFVVVCFVVCLLACCLCAYLCVGNGVTDGCELPCRCWELNVSLTCVRRNRAGGNHHRSKPTLKLVSPTTSHIPENPAR